MHWILACNTCIRHAVQFAQVWGNNVNNSGCGGSSKMLVPVQDVRHGGLTVFHRCKLLNAHVSVFVWSDLIDFRAESSVVRWRCSTLGVGALPSLPHPGIQSRCGIFGKETVLSKSCMRQTIAARFRVLYLSIRRFVAGKICWKFALFV